MPRELSRRRLLKRLLFATGGLVAARCAPKSNTPAAQATATTALSIAPPVASTPVVSPSVVRRSVSLTILHVNDFHGAAS